MIVEYLTDFAYFLNQNGFDISETHISRFLEAQSYECDLPEAEVIDQMQIFFCKNAQQSATFKPLYIEYTKKEKRTDAIKKLKREKEKKQIFVQKDREQTAAKIAKLKEDICKAEMARKEKGEQSIKMGTKTDTTKIQKILSEKSLQKAIPKNIKSILQSCVKNCGCTAEEASELMGWTEQLPNISKIYLEKGKIDVFTNIFELHKLLTKMLKLSKQQIMISTDDSYCEKLKGDLQRLQQQAERDERRHQKEQEDIDKKIKEAFKVSTEIIQKRRAVSHRPEFNNGKNAVQSTMLPEFSKKEFNSLSPQQQKEIYQYIRKNALSFKTRLGRYLRTGFHPQVDMMATIQEACRYGYPMKIINEAQKRSRPSLVLILDVSGSCKHASKMMLLFMHVLKDVFPGGCKVYAFTNKLYDISEALEIRNAEKAINTVLNSIPRSGAYSNYHRPLKEIWEKHHPEIKKDSMVIFMGDARNNKNPSGEEYLKNIVRRSGSRHAYWLNTDNINKWDQGDSIASTYAAYMPMLEVRTPEQLIRFIENL